LPCSINPTVPESVQTVLLKALAKGRKDRYAKVEDLVSAFAEAVNQAPGAAMPDLAVAGAATRRGPAPRAEPARKPPVPVLQEPAATLKEPVQAEPQTAKGRSWLWAVAGIAITCICLSAFLLLTRQERLARSASVPLATEVARIQPVVPVDTRPSLAEAQSAVLARPDDPTAHMKLAEAYLAHDDPRRSVDEFVKTAQLARKSEDYGLVTDATLRALEVAGGPDKVASEQLDSVAEFLFMSADTPRMLPVAEKVGAVYPDWDVPPAAAARTFLSSGNLVEARLHVNSAVDHWPDSPLTRAVRVELNLIQGNTREAAGEASDILNKGTIPGWLADHLKVLLDKAGGS
jgi:hypothetical protein